MKAGIAKITTRADPPNLSKVPLCYELCPVMFATPRPFEVVSVRDLDKFAHLYNFGPFSLQEEGLLERFRFYRVYFLAAAKGRPEKLSAFKELYEIFPDSLFQDVLRFL